MSTIGARGVMETTNPETANYYLRFGWKLLSQYTVPATEDAPEKVRYVLAAIAGIEDTRRLVDVPDVAEANAFLELGWRLVEKYVTTPDCSGGPNSAGGRLQPQQREEQIHFVLAWQREEDPPTPGVRAPRLLREHVTQFESSEEIRVEP